MSPGGAAQPFSVGAPDEARMEEDQPGSASARPSQLQPKDVSMSPDKAAQPPHLGAAEDDPMSPGGAAQPFSVGAPDEARMEEDQPNSASARPSQLQPQDASMSSGKAAQPPHLGVAEDDPMESPSLSPSSLFADLLRTGDLTGEPYPCAREGAEDSGQEEGASHLAGSGRGRLHTSTGHIRHVPGPYRMKFLSPTDPLPRPPSPGSVSGQKPAPDPSTAEPLGPFSPIPAERIEPASSGFGAEFDSAARNSQPPPPEGPKPAPPAPPVSGMAAKWRAVAMGEPQPDEDPIYRHLLTQVSKIASSTLDNEASLQGPTAVLQGIFATCKAFKIPVPGIPPPKPPRVANFDGVPAFRVPVSQWAMKHYFKELGDRVLTPGEKAKAESRVSIMASALAGPQRTQLAVAKKRALSIGLIMDCGRFEVPLPFPHAPLFLDEEEHIRVWEALLHSQWGPEWNPRLAPLPKGPKGRKDPPGPSK